MKNLWLIILTAGLGAGCGKKENADARKPGAANPPKDVTLKPPPTQPKVAEKPQKLITDPIVENKIRKEIKKPKGELTKADLEKVTELFLFNNPPRRGPQGSGQAPAAHISSGGRHRNNADGCG